MTFSLFFPSPLFWPPWADDWSFFDSFREPSPPNGHFDKPPEVFGKRDPFFTVFPCFHAPVDLRMATASVFSVFLVFGFFPTPFNPRHHKPQPPPCSPLNLRDADFCVKISPPPQFSSVAHPHSPTRPHSSFSVLKTNCGCLLF